MDHRRARELGRSRRGRGIGGKTAALALLASGVLYFAATASAAGPGGWDHLGHGATASTPALDGSVDALNADNPGTLYVGGNFLNAGGHAAADHIASWNGSAWSTVGPNLNGDVHATQLVAAFHRDDDGIGCRQRPRIKRPHELRCRCGT